MESEAVLEVQREKCVKIISEDSGPQEQVPVGLQRLKKVAKSKCLICPEQLTTRVMSERKWGLF